MKKLRRNIWTWAFLLLISGILGCSDAPSTKHPQKSLSQADQAFIEICQKELNLRPVVQRLENTAWIYFPLEENFLDYKATGEGFKKPKEFSIQPSIYYLEALLENKNLLVAYYIQPLVSYPVEYGYESVYTEHIQQLFAQVPAAVVRAYSDTIAPEKAPDFFVLVFADITRGLEARLTAYFEDLKRGILDPAFSEEYQKRVQWDFLVGNIKAVGDKEGKYLEIKEWTWLEFMAKQIEKRIRFKYEQSSMKPSKDDEPLNILKECTLETLEGYHFKGFDSISFFNSFDSTTTPLK